MIRELAFAVDAYCQAQRDGTFGGDPASGLVWRSSDVLNDSFRTFLLQLGGTGQVVLTPPPSGTGSVFIISGTSAPPPVPSPTSAEILARIQSAFRLSITELAAILKVERPTIYAWMSETGRPHVKNFRRLQVLNELAGYWNRVSSEPLGIGSKSSFDDGKSVLDLLCNEDIPVTEVSLRLRQLARVQGERSIKSVRSRLNRNKTSRSRREGDPDLLT